MDNWDVHLNKAIYSRDIEAARQALENSASVTRGVQIEYRFNAITPLCQAIECGCSVEFITLLLEKNAPVNGFYNLDDPLLAVIVSNHPEKQAIITLLLAKGANIHNDKERALCVAVMTGDILLVQFLIDKGANIYELDRENNNLFHVFAHINPALPDEVIEELFTFLKKHGVAINGLNKNDETPMDIAVSKKYNDLAAWLLVYGGQANKVTITEGIQCQKVLYEQKSLSSIIDKFSQNTATMVSILIVLGVLVSMANYYGSFSLDSF